MIHRGLVIALIVLLLVSVIILFVGGMSCKETFKMQTIKGGDYYVIDGVQHRLPPLKMKQRGRVISDETARFMKRGYKVFEKACKKFGIVMWVGAGGLIGAVRHKGFVPWDDDLDLYILEKDYKKLLRKKFRNFLKKRGWDLYTFVYEDKNMLNHPGIHEIALRLMRTKRKGFSNPWIDIFIKKEIGNRLFLCSKMKNKYCVNYFKKKEGYLFHSNKG